jgi:hypothetical protein
MQDEIEKLEETEQSFQLLMTIHHMSNQIKLTVTNRIFDLSIYDERYSLHLMELTMIDFMNRKFRNGEFSFD